jgi:chemotaxis methyl-accepting protein methylase
MIDDPSFAELLNRFELSWDGYRKVRKGVKKRIARHMRDLHCRTMEEYLHVLDRDREAREECERLLTVTISRFFRDLGTWRAIEREILPELAESGAEKVKAWSAGCACGEEAYTLNILWRERMRRGLPAPPLEIRATDRNPEVLEKAREGIYNRSSLKEMPDDLRDRYLRRIDKNQWTVDESLKQNIFWREYDLLNDPPPAKNFNIVFARNNLLTYLRDRPAEGPLGRMVEALRPGGFFVRGAKEKFPEDLPPSDLGLEQTDAHPHVYRKTS